MQVNKIVLNETKKSAASSGESGNYYCGMWNLNFLAEIGLQRIKSFLYFNCISNHLLKHVI